MIGNLSYIQSTQPGAAYNASTGGLQSVGQQSCTSGALPSHAVTTIAFTDAYGVTKALTVDAAFVASLCQMSAVHQKQSNRQYGVYISDSIPEKKIPMMDGD